MRAAICIFLALLAGCEELIGSREDEAVCQQTYEFGNTGCVDVEGLVTDRAGRPLEGAYAGVARPVRAEPHVTLSGGFPRTSAEGKYRLRVFRMVGAPTTTPDTLSVWVRAGVPPDPPVVGVPGPADSAVVVLELSPVGTRAKVVTPRTLVVPVN